MNYAIELQSISKKFNDTIIFTDISMKIKKGEIIAICGESGSGKTTLLQIIGLLEEATNGKILINKINQTQQKEIEKNIIRRQEIGFIYQFHHLCKEFSALENVMLPLLINGFGKAIAKEQALRELKEINLHNKANQYPDQLSGGEKQRIAIARATAHNPNIIIADEPTGSLDPIMSEHIFNILVNKSKKTKTTVLIATHSSIIAQKCNKIFDIQKKQFL